MRYEPTGSGRCVVKRSLRRIMLRRRASRVADHQALAWAQTLRTINDRLAADVAESHTQEGTTP